MQKYHVLSGLIFLMFCFPLLQRTPVSAQEIVEEVPELRFGVVADVQYRDADPEAGRYFRQSTEKLSEAVRDFNTRSLDFVIQLGDLIDRDFQSFRKVLPIYQQIKVPAYHVLGNHDFWVEIEKREDVVRILGLERGYYDFSERGWRLIVLDGNDLSLYASGEKEHRYAEAETMLSDIRQQGLPQAQRWNGGLGAVQIEWLRDTLAESLQEGQRAIVFCHFPVYPADQHILWNADEVIATLEEFPHVVAYINGHNHAGNYAKKEGIHYLNLKGMVDTPDTNAYTIIEVYPDYLKVLGKGREPERFLPID